MKSLDRILLIITGNQSCKYRLMVEMQRYAPNLGYSVREFCSEGSISILFDEVFGSDVEIEVETI